MKPVAIVAFMVFASGLVLAQAPASSTGSADTRPQATADSRPVTGARNLSLGSDSEHENLLETGLSFTQSGTSNARLASSSSDGDWSAVSTVSGNATLSRSTKVSTTDLSYRGGANFYSADAALNTQSHLFGVAETINLSRWSVTLADHFDYEPDGGSGIGLFGNVFGSEGADLRPGYLPDSSLLTPLTTRLMNTSVGELEYRFSRKTSVTATGSYSLMNFPDSSLLDSTQRSLSGGLNHSFGRNTFGVSYNNTMFKYKSLPETMQTHGVELTIARRVSGRLSFDAGAGPEVLVTTISGYDRTEVLATGHLALRRQDGRTLTSLSYSRGVTGGAGVVPGAKSDQVAAGIARSFGRDVSLTVSTGYARNTATLIKTTFNTFNATAAVSRRLGRNASMSLGYSYQRQLSDGMLDHLQNHAVMFTFSWAFRPIRLK